LLVLDLVVPDHGQQVIDYVKHHQLDVLRGVIVVTAVPNLIRSASRGEYHEPIGGVISAASKNELTQRRAPQ
jgi:hypothetical protein